MAISTYIPSITSNVQWTNASIKKNTQWQIEWKDKNKTRILQYAAYETHTGQKDTYTDQKGRDKSR